MQVGRHAQIHRVRLFIRQKILQAGISPRPIPRCSRLGPLQDRIRDPAYCYLLEEIPTRAVRLRDPACPR